MPLVVEPLSDPRTGEEDLAARGQRGREVVKARGQVERDGLPQPVAEQANQGRQTELRAPQPKEPSQDTYGESDPEGQPAVF